MKQRTTNLLLLREGAYRVLQCDGTNVTTGEPHPTIAAALAGVEKGGVVLGTPSNWCLCATIDLANLPRQRRQAMLYRLEEQLPLSAEDFVGDFLEGTHTALGIAGQLRLLQPAVTAVEAAGFKVEGIAPAALLAANWYFTRKLPDGDILLFGQDGQIELVRYHGTRVSAWETLPPDPDDVATELRVRMMKGPLSIVAGPMPIRLTDVDGVKVEPADLPSADEAAANMAYVVAGGGAAGARWSLVDLYREPLGVADAYRGARTAIRAAVIAAVFLVTAIFGAVLWRANEYQRLAADAERQQQEIFNKTFPGKSLRHDLSVATQLLGEERRLRGLAGGDGGDVPTRVSSLALLHRVLASLPEGKCRVSELDVKEDRVTIEAVVPMHTDAEVVYAALSADKSLVVERPFSERTADGQSATMTLTATAASPKGGGR